MEGHLMATNFEKLRAKLEEMFMLDRADLDFGIYRIMNSKRDEILRFLDKDLLPQVRQVLQAAQGEIGAAGADELKQAEEQVRSLGMNPDDSPKVKELRAKYSAGGDLNALEQEVFNHLYSFFRRYYDEGDFLSLRRYKEGVYAIPYEGEEVKLHWANADQYYIKTAEHFRDYTFKVGGDRRVHFKLVDAETEKDNNKSSEKRVFILTGENAVAEENGELLIRFEYRAAPDKRKQKEHVEEAVTRILTEAHGDWKGLLHAKAPTDKSPNRTVLEKHLTDYTARNTLDYFIHKDLGGFLRRELDFYIKNEVMHLDDIEHESCPKVEQYLAKVRAIRRVAGKLIDFLVQLEEFQKRLWLKKKFVTRTRWLLSMSLLPEQLHIRVVENTSQWDQWEQWYGVIVPISERSNYLHNHPGLVVDTALFDEQFSEDLQRQLEDIDGTTTGCLVRSDNMNALRFIEARYRAKVDAVYIDPPYNTPHSEILYKNNFKHSTWMSLINNTLPLVPRFWADDFTFGLAIDDFEQVHLGLMLDQRFPQLERSTIVINHHPQGAGGRLSRTHEYYMVLSKPTSAALKGRPRIDESEERAFMRSGSAENNFRRGRWKSFYALLIDPSTGRVVDAEEPVPLGQPYPTEPTLLGLRRVYPVNSRGEERVWRSSFETGRQRARNGELILSDGGTVYQDINHEGKRETLFSNWTDSQFNAGIHGTNVLSNLGLGGQFNYPKAVNTLITSLWAQTFGKADACVLDFFAGSGTTGHAVLQMNREDGHARKFLLVDVGNHFDTVIVPRLSKVAFSPDWVDGRAINFENPVPVCLRVIYLESYEDTLANLKLGTPSEGQVQLLEGAPDVREDYMLRYCLASESAGSTSLLSVRSLAHPFSYTLDIATDIVGETRRVRVDLVETFNWLLGLRVHTMDVIRGFHVVTGRLPGPSNSENGEKALIIWRDTTENPNEKLDEFFAKQAYNTLDQEFDVIYVNGDNNLQNLRKDDQTWKVRLIEEEFHRLMWDVEDV